MRRLGFVIAVVIGALAAPVRAGTTDEPIDPDAAVEPRLPTVQLVQAWPKTKQALLYDPIQGTYVVVAAGQNVDGFRVTRIGKNQIVLSTLGGEARDYVLLPTPVADLPDAPAPTALAPKTPPPGPGTPANDPPSARQDVIDPYPAGTLDPYGSEGVRTVDAPPQSKASATPPAPTVPATMPAPVPVPAPAPTKPAADATADATGPDASTARCDRTKPFGAPQTLIPPPLGCKSFAGPSITADENTIAYQCDVSTTAGNDWDIYTVSRPSSTGQWGVPALAKGVNSPGIDIDPFLSSDGLTMIFTTDGWPVLQGHGCCYYDLYISTRTSLTDSWSQAMQLTALDSDYGDANGYLLPDRSAIYFDSDRVTQGSADIYRATVSGMTYGTPEPVAEINSSSGDGYPAVTADDLQIYWSSSRADGMGGLDIWTASRATVGEAFTSLRDVTELNSTNDDIVRGVSPDGCRLYFQRAGGGFAYADRMP
jgi:hypothetical protein